MNKGNIANSTATFCKLFQNSENSYIAHLLQFDCMKLKEGVYMLIVVHPWRICLLRTLSALHCKHCVLQLLRTEHLTQLSGVEHLSFHNTHRVSNNLLSVLSWMGFSGMHTSFIHLGNGNCTHICYSSFNLCKYTYFTHAIETWHMCS